MEIQITQDNIDQGKICNSNDCPVALALKENTGNNWIVDEFELIDLKNKRIYDTPSIVRYFIRKFDTLIKDKKDNIYVGLKDLSPLKFYLNREHSRYYFKLKQKYDGRSLVRKWGFV